MVKKYTSKTYKGSEIRISKEPAKFDNNYYATSFSGMLVAKGKTKTEALNEAKKKINKAVSSIKKK